MKTTVPAVSPEKLEKPAHPRQAVIRLHRRLILTRQLPKLYLVEILAEIIRI